MESSRVTSAHLRGSFRALVRKLWLFVAVALAALTGLAAVAFREGWLQAPWSSRYAELSAQLRDRGTVAVAGGVPWALPSGDATLAPVSRFADLAAALDAGSEPRVADAYRGAHLDGLLVRTDRPVGPASSVARALSEMRASERLTAVYLDDTAALYEAREPVTLDPADARRLITVARLVLSGAVAPPERIFPEALRRPRPVEVALMIRDGRDAILWRSTRGGSIAKAFIDVCFAVLDRWTSRQQERYGRLRDGLRSLSLTLAIFYDKGVLGARAPEFLRRAADPHVWAVGYERLATWEYSLPPTPWSPAPDPTEALRALTRERGVAPPGHLRPELTLYRFRALQAVEKSPAGEVQLFDPR